MALVPTILFEKLGDGSAHRCQQSGRTNSPIDTVHRARALGMSLQELREEQPQIFAMLKTEFRSAIVGFETAAESLNGYAPKRGTIYQYIPPRPPQIHQAVYRCEPDEVIDFSAQLDFLRTLLGVANAPVEALTAKEGGGEGD